jgi:hypothetical protein
MAVTSSSHSARSLRLSGQAQRFHDAGGADGASVEDTMPWTKRLHWEFGVTKVTPTVLVWRCAC